MSIDELFLTFEKTQERQERLIKTVAAALGATPEEDYDSGDMIEVANINLDQGPVAGDGAKKDEKMNYAGGDIRAGRVTAFGYQTVDSID